MPILVSAHQLTKAFGARPLFKDLTFAIESDERIGLIGPNGAGKSTLLKILAGIASQDSGTLSMQRGLRVGLLEQVPELRPGATIMSTILEGATGGEHDWEAHSLAQEYLSKFHLDAFGAETKVEKLSGGWKKRVALARELVRRPDLMLLDEPTNHLDVESILWLESLIARSRFATLTITHDRLFLQRIANRIIELDPRHPGGLLNVPGDYATYVELREQMISAQERREVILKNTLRRETEWLRRGAKARTTKQQARIQRHGELSEVVEDLNTRNQTRTARIDFQSADRNPKKLVVAKGISKSYDGRKIFAPLDLMMTPGTRLGLLGPNGSGKSTLIRCLLGTEPSDTGTVTRADQLQVAYFDQAREALDPTTTLAKTLCPTGDFVDYRGGRVHIRSYLDRFLFTQGQSEMQVGKLSGGEQARILIARLMLKPANMLVLDEPTNDLDLATLAVLEECLTEFNGAVILVTHDRYFLDQVANKILAFPPFDGGDRALVPFASLSQWEDWHAEELAKAGAKKDEKSKSSQGGGGSGKRKKLSFKDQRELDTMESTIHGVEEKLAKLTEESADPKNASNSIVLAKLTQEMGETQSEIERLYMRWSELAGE